MKRKNTISVMVVIAMMLATLQLPVFALNWQEEEKIQPQMPDENTFEVATAAQLAWVAEQVNEEGVTFEGKTVKLTADIDLSGKEWTPIGTYENGDEGKTFQGSFDGQNHTIKGLQIGTEAAPNTRWGACGLFGYAAGRETLSNLHLTDVQIFNTNDYTGALAGRCETGIINGVSVTGEMIGGNQTGGLAGHASDSQLKNCAMNGTVKADGVIAGGLAGYCQAIVNSYAVGTVSASSFGAGGLAGHASEVYNCYSAVDLSSSHNVGALVHRDISGDITIQNSYWDASFSHIVNGKTLTDEEKKGVGYIQEEEEDMSTKLAASDMKSGVLLESLNDNGNEDWRQWAADEEGINQGYPVLTEDTISPDRFWIANAAEPQLNEGMYEIDSAEKLAWVAQKVNRGEKTFEGETILLTSDIDLSGKFWIPIGKSTETPFRGLFDGNQHVVKNLRIGSEVAPYGRWYAGLFGYTKGVQIQDVGLELAQIYSGASNVGGLVGTLEGGQVARCYVVGDIRGKNEVGGLIGEIGNDTATIENCSTMAQVSGGWYVGGLVGEAEFCTIINCIAGGNVWSTRHFMGGLVGMVDQQIEASGCRWNQSAIHIMYNQVIENGLKQGIGTGADDIAGNTADELKLADTYTGWDFDTIWAMDSQVNGGFPHLAYQKFGEPTPILALTLNKTAMSLFPRQSEQLTCMVAPPNAQAQPLVWTSDNEVVASVDGNGMVTAKAGGTAVITVQTQDGAWKAACRVNVQKPDTEYIVNKITCTDSSGAVLDPVVDADTFYAEMNVTCFSDSADRDYVILASYDGQGALLGLSYMRCSMKDGETYDFGTSIQNKDRQVGMIKAFVWGSLDGMRPLSNSVEKKIYPSADKYAILDNAYLSESADAVSVKLILSTGKHITYEVDERNFGGTLAGAAEKLKSMVYDGNGEKLPVQKRVVAYKINSVNTITRCEQVNGTEAIDKEYDANRMRVGSVRMDETTKILNANDPADITTATLFDLKDKVKYDVYGFDKSNDGISRFVVITSDDSGITKDTRLAAFSDLSFGVNPDTDETCQYINVVGAAKDKYVLEDGYDVVDNSGTSVTLSKGDVIILETNTKGEVTKVTKLFDNTDTYTNYIGDFMNGGTFPDSFTLPGAWSDPSDNIELAFGAITEKNGNRVVLSSVSKDGDAFVSKYDDRWDVTCADDVNVMVYDFSESKANRLKVGIASDIRATVVTSATDENKDLIEWDQVTESTLGEMNYAFAKIVDEEITDIFVILAE